MTLGAGSVERVRAYCRAWEAQGVLPDRVSVALIGDERFTRMPEHLRERIDAHAPTNLAALIEILGDDVERAVGEARLSFVDAGTLRPVATDDVFGVGDDDARLAALQVAADRREWLEASADEPCDVRSGVVDDDDALLAVATLQILDGTLGQLGVFTASPARGRGLATKVGCAVAAHALARDVVPQWRSRIGNDSSAAVADRLGFVALGRQFTVLVKTRD